MFKSCSNARRSTRSSLEKNHPILAVFAHRASNMHIETTQLLFACHLYLAKSEVHYRKRV